jgi:hypothetical protein
MNKTNKPNKKYFAILLALILFILFDTGVLISKTGIGINSAKAINSRFKNEISVWRLKRVISEVNLDNNKRLVFYENANGNVMFSILKKKWNGMWKTIDTSGELAFRSENVKVQPVSFFSGNLSGTWINCGVIYNDEASTVKFNGKDANILDMGYIRLWYSLASRDNSLKIDLYNSKGEKLN